MGRALGVVYPLFVCKSCIEQHSTTIMGDLFSLHERAKKVHVLRVCF
jgi:hypothetical protein